MRISLLCTHAQVTDQSGTDGENAAVHRMYTLEALFNTRDSERAITTLEVPRSGTVTDGIAPFATDRRAYDLRRYCPEKDETGRDRPYPCHELEWSSVSLKGTIRDFSISPTGSGAWIECITGMIWCALLRPKGNLDDRQLACTTIFAKDPRLDMIMKQLDVEGVLLLPGMRLFIRPGTPYCYWALANSVCNGGYFFALSTMPYTFAALLHNIANMSSFTPNDNPRFQHLVRLVVQHAYVAIILQEDDPEFPLSRHFHSYRPSKDEDHKLLMGLLAAIYTGILCNVLDPNTYRVQLDLADSPKIRERIGQVRMEQYDYNAMPHDDRLGCMFVRGCAYELARWFNHHFEIQVDDRTIDLDRIIAAQAFSVIQQAKRATPRHGVLFDSDNVQRQTLGTFAPESRVSKILANKIRKGLEDDTPEAVDLIPDKSTFHRVRRLRDVEDFHPRTMDEIHASGVSPLDKKYQDGALRQFEVSLADDNGRKKRRVTV